MKKNRTEPEEILIALGNIRKKEIPVERRVRESIIEVDRFRKELLHDFLEWYNKEQFTGEEINEIKEIFFNNSCLWAVIHI